MIYLFIVNNISNEITLEGLSHCFVVAPSKFPHEILVKVFADTVYRIDGCLELIFFLLSNIQYLIGVPPPFSLYDVPDLLDRVQFTTLRW